MSDEQSIRDELVDRINDELDKWGEGPSSPYAIADAISPVIRRIQAEARAAALDDAVKVLARRSVAFFHIEAVRALGES